MTSGHDGSLEQQAHPDAARDQANWASMAGTLHVTEIPDGVANINVEGLRVVGAVQGFGQLWRKTYRIRLDGAAVTPAEVVAVWKERFSSFWPRGSRFHAPLTGLAPGVVALLDQMLPGRLRLSSGVMVLCEHDEHDRAARQWSAPCRGSSSPATSAPGGWSWLPQRRP